MIMCAYLNNYLIIIYNYFVLIILIIHDYSFTIISDYS